MRRATQLPVLEEDEDEHNQQEEGEEDRDHEFKHRGACCFPCRGPQLHGHALAYRTSSLHQVIAASALEGPELE